MMRKTTVVAMLGAAALVLAACDTMDDVAGQSQAERAYSACQPYHHDKSRSLGKSWAFVSGVNGDGSSSCRWSFNYPNAAAAAKAAFDACRAAYSGCWVFATSDGLSPWVRTMADNIAAGRDPNIGLSGDAQNSGGSGEREGDNRADNAEPRHIVTLSRDDGSGEDDNNSDDDGGDSSDDGPSWGDVIRGITEGIKAGTAIGEAMRGGGAGGGSYSGTPAGGGGVSCPVGFHIYMPYSRDPVCQPNAQGSGTPAGTNRSTITGP